MVFEELRKRIHEGIFKPAECLTEVALAAEFGVSRSTIKKALMKLESENLVIMEENKRASVRFFTLDEAIEYLELRELLDCFILRRTIPLLKRSDLSEMKQALDGMKEALSIPDVTKCSANNGRFYDVIYRSCPNHPAVDMVRVIRNQLRRFNIKTVFIPGRGDASLAEHRGILDAIQKQDADLAEKLMHEHMVNLRSVLRKNYQLLF
jgi:DNA-binding GntR family transcriptional regulator